MNNPTKMRVGAWTVSPALNVLERGERSVKLEPRAMDVLVCLADRAGDVVSVEDLLAAVWKGVVVGDGSVYLAIKQLRQALAAAGDDTAYIETIPKRGYRLTVSVERVPGSQNAATMTPANAPTEPAPGAPWTRSYRTLLSGTRVGWLVAAALAVALVAALVPATRELFREPRQATAILDLEVPGYVAGGLAVSPDGRFIAYTSESDGPRRIWVRPLAAAARPLAGTEQAATAFWSPDSRNLAFITDDGTLKRVDVESGLVQVLTEASMAGVAWGSGAWSRDGAILHNMQAETAGGAPSGLEAIESAAGFPIGTAPASGGALVAMTRPDLTNGETGHFVPRLLPDDDHFVYIGAGPHLPMATIYLSSRTAATRTALVSIEDLVQANRRWNLAYANGYLLYSRGSALVVQRIDLAARAVVGEPRTVAQEVVDEFAVSETGMLVYSENAAPVLPIPQQRRLSWFDRNGRRIGEIDARGAFAGPALSPDERRVAVSVLAATPGVSDISIVDAERGASLPITVDDAGDGPVLWSPDGERVAFSSGRGSIPFAPSAIYEQSAGGTGPQRLLFAGAAGELVLPSHWSVDVILFSRASKIGAKQMDIWALSTSGEQSAIELVASPARKVGAKLSSDGRWIAYTTDESGRDEVVVQPYPAVNNKQAISTRGGSSPRWRSDGSEIFYVAPDGMLTAVEVLGSGEHSLELGQSHELFAITQAADAPTFDYEVAENGERFLVSEPADDAAVADEPAHSLRVIFNWTALLGDR